MSKTEMTPGGSIIVRHDGKISADNDIGHADDERISAHIKKHIHGDGTVFHEIVSDHVHIDVHLLPPCEK
ncbi:MAG TPA: suppressor of fused domain protein, partial [Spirochaetota bacterium]